MTDLNFGVDDLQAFGSVGLWLVVATTLLPRDQGLSVIVQWQQFISVVRDG